MICVYHDGNKIVYVLKGQSEHSIGELREQYQEYHDKLLPLFPFHMPTFGEFLIGNKGFIMIDFEQI